MTPPHHRSIPARAGFQAGRAAPERDGTAAKVISNNKLQMIKILYFDLGIYSTLAIEKACYRFSDRLVFDIKTDQDRLLVEIGSRAPEINPVTFELHVNDFRSEALDQNLREKIKSETAGVRNLILAHAFSRTGLIGQEAV